MDFQGEEQETWVPSFWTRPEVVRGEATVRSDSVHIGLILGGGHANDTRPRWARDKMYEKSGVSG